MARFSVGVVACLVVVLIAGAEAFAPVTIINKQNLVPEGIEYNPLTGNLLLGSIGTGVIHEVTQSGKFKVFSDDESLTSTAGLQVDQDRGYLFACNQEKIFPATSNRAGLAVLSLRDGSLVRYVDLSNFLGSSGKLLNDVSPPDSKGFVYVTDSLNGAIYQVNPDTGDAVLYFQSDSLKPDDAAGVGANGIEVWREKGDKSNEFLIIAKSGLTTKTAILYRLDLGLSRNDREIKAIEVDEKGVGYDGLFVVRSGARTGTLYAVSSEKVYSFISADFKTASAGDVFELTSPQGTTAVYLSDDDVLAVNCLNNFNSTTTFIDVIDLSTDALVNSSVSLSSSIVFVVVSLVLALLF